MADLTAAIGRFGEAAVRAGAAAEHLLASGAQLIPPGAARLHAHVPYTDRPTPAGSWSAPHLARARRLVAASGTRGSGVRVWGFPRYAALTRYAGAVLRRLGYRVHVRVFADADRYFAYVTDTRHRARVGLSPREADFMTAGH